MGLFGNRFKNEIILNSSSIVESDIIQRKYVNEIVTITGRVKFQSIIIEQSRNFGCYFEDTNARIGVVDCCEALYSFLQQTKIRDYDGEITVTGKLVIPNTPRPMYQVMLERRSDIRFKYKLS